MSPISTLHSGPWCGALTDTSAIVKATFDARVLKVQLVLRADPEGDVLTVADPFEVWTDPEKAYPHQIVTFRLDSLLANTSYRYSLMADGAPVDETGRFRTLPVRGTKADLHFCCGSCTSNRKWLGIFQRPAVFDAIRQEQPQFFAHLGDFYYDIRSGVIAKRLACYDWTLRRPRVARLLREVPIAYIWDDHDFLGEGREGGDPSEHRRALNALEAYDRHVPHYDLSPGRIGIHQTFTAGRVLFVLTDTRFARTPRRAPDTSQKSMLGKVQRAWLESWLLTGRDHFDLIVWANSVPWLGNEAARDEAWAGYTAERRILADFIKAKNIRNLCMICGDAHMLAVDDGRHGCFASDGRGGFPVFHAAALESRPSRKGGLYTIGTLQGTLGRGIPGFGQYGIVDVIYDKSESGEAMGSPRVRFTGRRTEANGATRTLIEYEFPAERTFGGF